MNVENLKVEWLGHAGFLIAGSKRLVFDPYKVSDDVGKADYLFISHEHFDHCSLEDIEKVANEGTVVFCATECVSKVTKIKIKNMITLQPGETKEYEDIIIEAVPAYNINKFRSPGVPYHPKEDNKLGFIITLDTKRIYFAGDTDGVPELTDLKNIDIALIPVSGTYVMIAEEAAELVNKFKPKLAIPMHYNEIVGTEAEAKVFKELCKVPVEILEKI